jgi:hypothetical protein
MTDPRKEAQEKLAKAGFKIGASGSIELVDAPQTAEDLAGLGAPNPLDPPAPPTANLVPPIQEPPAPKVDTPPAPNPQEHDWKKREEDAKEAQRGLSRFELQLKRREDELNARFASLDAKEKELNEKLSKLTTPAAPSKEALQALLDEYPALAEGMKALIHESLESDPRLARVSKQDERLDRFAEFTEETTRAQRLAEVTQAVLAIEPDAVQIARDPIFREWTESLPVRVRDDYEKAVYTHSADYEPEYIAHIIRSYKATKGVTAAVAAPTQPAVPQPPRAPQVPPALAGGRQNAQETLTPLSDEERSSIGRLMRESAHDPAARKRLMARMELTY